MIRMEAGRKSGLHLFWRECLRHAFHGSHCLLGAKSQVRARCWQKPSRGPFDSSLPFNRGDDSAYDHTGSLSNWNAGVR